MLGKLMKYEIRATQRIFLPLYGLIFVFALLIRLFMSLNMQNAQGMAIMPFAITMAIYCLLIAAVFVMTLVVTIQRFHKNLLGDEGYLSFTLPVTVHSHISSKMIISLMWSVASLIVSVLSAMILVTSQTDLTKIREFMCQFGQVFMNKYGFWCGLIIVELIALMIVGTLSFILQLYASVTVGNFSSKHKLLAGFGAFIGFSVVEQILTSFLFNIGNNLTSDNALRAFWNGTDDLGKLQGIAGFMGAGLAYEAVFGLAFYFLTNWLLSDKLNLE